MQHQRWGFLVDWLDPNSGVKWTYQLFVHLSPDAPLEVEMVDVKNRRQFLKRVKYEGLQASQLYLGSTVVVFSRQLCIREYADEATRRAVEAQAERTLALIKPDAVQHHVGPIINTIYASGSFSIINLRMCQLSPTQAADFYAAQQGSPQFEALVAFLCSGPVVALELMAAGGVKRWLDILGPIDSAAAKQQAPGSIRAMFGTDVLCNAAHGSDSTASAAAELSFFFGTCPGSSSSGSRAALGTSSSGSRGSTSWAIGSCSSSGAAPCRTPSTVLHGCSRCHNTTLGVILPHAVKAGVVGLMLQDIQQAAFEITGLQLLNIDKQAGAEFLEVYKGVVPSGEFSAMVDELIAGPCIAVEVACHDGRPPVEAFRQLVGPRDPELGRVLRPNTLRARFGTSRVCNAIHCTDLEEDGPLETSYFFDVLQQPRLVGSCC